MVFKIQKCLTPYISVVLAESNQNDYTIQSASNGLCTVDINMSGREFKKFKRMAWAKKIGFEVGLPVLSREDIATRKSGVILKKESYFFNNSFL